MRAPFGRLFARCVVEEAVLRAWEAGLAGSLLTHLHSVSCISDMFGTCGKYKGWPPHASCTWAYQILELPHDTRTEHSPTMSNSGCLEGQMQSKRWSTALSAGIETVGSSLLCNASHTVHTLYTSRRMAHMRTGVPARWMRTCLDR